MRVLVVLLILLCPVFAMATEEAKYTVVRSDGDVEIRRYEKQILAEVIIKGGMGAASNRAFRPLFNYISGNNVAHREIAMTSPVSQKQVEGTGEEIAMTAPVSVVAANNTPDDKQWAVSFMMPAKFTMETIPVPENTRVNIREVPERTVAAIRYSGSWSESRYQEHLDELQQWLKSNEFNAAGEPIWARYNSPMSLPIFRRNEVLIPLLEE